MVRQRTCIYEQFGTCKHGTNCNFLHPTLVCDDQKNCDIALCHKRHPQLCLYDTIFNKCMNEDSETCRFHHRSRNDIDEEKYIELEEKYNETLLRLNETLGDGNLGHQYWIKNWGQAYQNHL